MKIEAAFKINFKLTNKNGIYLMWICLKQI